MDTYTRTVKYDAEAIQRIQEKHRKDREEFNRKKLEENEGLTLAPDSPRPDDDDAAADDDEGYNR